MIKILKKNKGSEIEIKSILGDTEAMEFATKIKEIFIAAGWVVDGITTTMRSSPTKGVIIYVPSKNYPQRVNTIVESFKILKLNPEI